VEGAHLFPLGVDLLDPAAAHGDHGVVAVAHALDAVDVEIRRRLVAPRLLARRVDHHQAMVRADEGHAAEALAGDGRVDVFLPARSRSVTRLPCSSAMSTRPLGRTWASIGVFKSVFSSQRTLPAASYSHTLCACISGTRVRLRKATAVSSLARSTLSPLSFH